MLELIFWSLARGLPGVVHRGKVTVLLCILLGRNEEYNSCLLVLSLHQSSPSTTTNSLWVSVWSPLFSSRVRFSLHNLRLTFVLVSPLFRRQPIFTVPQTPFPIHAVIYVCVIGVVSIAFHWKKFRLNSPIFSYCRTTKLRTTITGLPPSLKTNVLLWNDVFMLLETVKISSFLQN